MKQSYHFVNFYYANKVPRRMDGRMEPKLRSLEDVPAGRQQLYLRCVLSPQCKRKMARNEEKNKPSSDLFDLEKQVKIVQGH